MPIAASAKGTPSSKHVSEYAQLGIIKKDDAFFYKNKRIRIFFDESFPIRTSNLCAKASWILMAQLIYVC